MQKYSALRRPQINGFLSFVSFPQEGRFAIVTDVGSGMRWTRQRQAQFFARTNDAAADGEVVWSWRSDAGAKVAESSANDGGNQAWSPRRARRKPLKPLRREGRMIRLYLWFCRVLFCCTRAMGAVGTRPSLRPLLFRGRSMVQLGCDARRENADLCLKLERAADCRQRWW